MRTKVPLKASYDENNIMLELICDGKSYITLHFIYSNGNHVGGTNLLSFQKEGLEFYLGIREIENLDLTEHESLKMVGFDLL